jgi:hypothetical protein
MPTKVISRRTGIQRKAFHQSHEFCIFTSAGDYHNIHSWLPVAETPGTSFMPPTFPKDSYKIFVVYYGNNNFDLEHPLLQHWNHKGMKFPNFKWWFIMHGASSGCNYIAVWDDDTVTNPEDIRKLFREVKDNQLDILGPTGGSTKDYRSLQPSGYSGVRDVEFVEMGTPVMKTSFVRRFLSEYDDHKIKDFGVDVWYSYKCVNDPKCKIAVTDNVHTINPPVRANGLREVESAPDWRTWENTWKAYAAEHNIPWKPPPSAYEKPRMPVSVKIGLSLTLLLFIFILYKAILLLKNGYKNRNKKKFSRSNSDDCDTGNIYASWKGFVHGYRSRSASV